MSNLIRGQEDFVHVWTLGEPGLGDGFDKLVTIDGCVAFRRPMA
jgi:selenium-binding protein 1